MRLTLALAGATAAGAYLNAKFHVKKDITQLWTLFSARKEYESYAKANKRSLWYRFEEQVERVPDEPAIWSRPSGDITYREVHRLACRYANWMKDDLGVRPGELVAFYLMNSLEMIVCYLATWAIGAAPSMINNSLSGKGLIHCLSIGGARVLLVDEDESCRQRIEEARSEIEALGYNHIKVMDRMQKGEIAHCSDERPGNEWRNNVQDHDPTKLLFTRFVTKLLALLYAY